MSTVEPPRKGRFGEMAYVPCREVVPISEVCLLFHCITLTHVFVYNEPFTVGIRVSSDSNSIRDVKAFAEVRGGRVNRGGLEVPCVYRLYGPKVYIEKMRELVNSLRTAGLL